MSSCARIADRPWRWLAAVAAIAWLHPPAGAATAVPVQRPVTFRITWGGGQPQAWTGRIAIVADGDASGAAEPVVWRTLSTEPDAASFVHDERGAIELHQPRAVSSDGIELTVSDLAGRRLVAAVRPAVSGGPPVTLDVPLTELFGAPASEPLDEMGNRLAARLAVGDQLRVTLSEPAAGADAGEASPSAAAVRRPGDRVRMTVDPLLLAKAEGGGPIAVTMRLVSAASEAPIATQETTLTPLDPPPAATAALRPQPVRFAPVSFDVELPAAEGAYDIHLEAAERSGLRWARPLATRTVQLVAVADSPATASEPAEWRLLYELDPASPKLHERLRRLPGLALPNVPLPAVPLPSMSLPSLPRPAVPLPKLPNVPVPGVPSLSSMMPRLSGLLATGHSRLEPHPLGPMLRLPPCGDTGKPSWEGVLVANAEPGLPHAVEIEFPSDQDASLGTIVLESDAAGAKVQVRHAGGFEVRPESGAARLGVHRFVFWPTTRQPLLVMANPTARPAAFGRVRVSVGPARLPAAAAPTVDGGRRRRLHAYVPDPALADFGGRDRRVRHGAGAITDWTTHVDAIRHLTEHVRARGAGGAMVTVYSSGAAIWPSRATRQAPRWGSGAGPAEGFDPAAKDVLQVLCRACGREGLRLLPAVVFDAPLPAVEAALARGGSDAEGIACIGRDGRPRRLGPQSGIHYNILDPRVQAAAIEVVEELVARTSAEAAVDGVAVVLAHDGWLHMPGVAWGLDDVTFGRFAADMQIEGPPADGNRFAARAALVEGPLRPQWLEWRAAQAAAFWTRLAAVATQGRAGRSLAIVPTTLLSHGDLAARFRPALAVEPRSGDILREIAFDPPRFAADPRVLYVAPQLSATAPSLAAEAARSAANRALAFTAVSRRAAVLLGESRPLDLSEVMSHGPFAAASLAGPTSMHPAATFSQRDRGLAEAHLVSDVEVVFDTGLARTLPAEPWASRDAVEALPAEPLDVLPGLPAPLVVRSRESGGRTWLYVVNAAATPASVTIALDREPLGVVDAVLGTRLPFAGTAVTLPVDAWGVRGVWVEGAVRVAAASIGYEPAVREAVVDRVARLKRRREQLELPVPLDVLDNPSFEMGGDAGDPAARSSVPGWEIVEARRSTLGLVAGREPAGSRAASFASANGLSTLRSNPFARPASGRLSIAAWLRIKDGEAQPPLRIALEGDVQGREYYRFAAIGGLAGGRPLTGQWSQFVLQVDDLPDAGLESLRVRFDLLGPGSVEIDDVRLFDLAFDESQRVQLTRLITGIDQRLAADDVGGCLVELAGHWPRYLEAFVPERVEPTPESADPPKRNASRLKMKNWWK